jgi:hypothetical protein
VQNRSSSPLLSFKSPTVPAPFVKNSKCVKDPTRRRHTDAVLMPLLGPRWDVRIAVVRDLGAIQEGVMAIPTTDEKRAHLTDLKRDHLIEQVCVQEILPPEKE